MTIDRTFTDMDTAFIHNYPLYVTGHADKITFAGALLKFLDTSVNDSKIISKYWDVKHPEANTTRQSNLSDYENRVLPFLPVDKALEDYTYDDFEEAFTNLVKAEKGNCNDFTDAYRDRYFRHYRVVYEAAVKANLFISKINWTNNSEYTEDEDENFTRAKGKKKILKRSFSIADEIKLANHFLEQDISTMAGSELGAYMMFFLGTRNNEAAAITFADFKPISNTDYNVLMIFKSVKRSSVEFKAGGKTRNAIRLIPVFKTLITKIEERRSYIANKLGITIEETANFPIACKDDYRTSVGATKISEAGSMLFETLNIFSKEEQNELNSQLRRYYDPAEYDEADPTAYTFRRNYMTRLYPLCSEPELQYIVGHDIESGYESRADFSSEERITEICRKFERHPFRILLNESIPSKNSISGKRVFIKTTEPLQKLHLAIKSGNNIHIRATTLRSTSPASEPVDVSNRILNMYRRAKEK